MIRFNELCSLVVEDGSSRNAMVAEEQVMLSLRQPKYGEAAVNAVGNANDEQRNAEIFHAFIEL